MPSSVGKNRGPGGVYGCLGSDNSIHDMPIHFLISAAVPSSVSEKEGHGIVLRNYSGTERFSDRFAVAPERVVRFHPSLRIF
jgi:hypothetical protein